MRSNPLPYVLSTLLLILLLRIVYHLSSLTPPPFKFETSTPYTLSHSSPNASKTRESLEKLTRILIANYTTWHKATRTRLESCRGCNETSRVKFVLAHGSESGHGLGDRFRAIIHAYLCAVGSNRFLMLDIPLPFPIGTAFGAGLSNFTYDETLLPPGANVTRLEGNQSHFDYFNNFLGDEEVVIINSDPYPRLDKFYMLRKDLSHLPVFGKLNTTVIWPQSVTNSEVYSLILGAMFRSTKDMRAVLEELVTGREGTLERLWSKGKKRIDVSHKYVSVHARLGYGLGEGRYERFNLTTKGFSMKQVADCMAGPAVEIAKEKGVNPARIYLGTDTPKFTGKFRRAVRRMGGTVMTANFKPQHIGLIRRREEKDKKTYLTTFVDLYLISRGEALLHLKSGFADLAGWMGGIRHRGMFTLEDECNLIIY